MVVSNVLYLPRLIKWTAYGLAMGRCSKERMPKLTLLCSIPPTQSWKPTRRAKRVYPYWILGEVLTPRFPTLLAMTC